LIAFLPGEGIGPEIVAQARKEMAAGPGTRVVGTAAMGDAIAAALAVGSAP
jgi:isocitrate/isopropylmalate dehydrogenase